MTGAEVLLICAISAVATALGWFAARLTLDTDGPAVPSSLHPRKAAPEKANATPRFVAIIRFPSARSCRDWLDDEAADQALELCAEMIDAMNQNIRVDRTTADSIECRVIADTENEATSIVQAALDLVTEFKPAGPGNIQKDPRAALIKVAHNHPRQRSFDLAAEALDSPKNSLEQVVKADYSESLAARVSVTDSISKLVEALKTDEVSLSYQPKLDVRDQAFKSAEALFRWDPEAGRQLSVGDMIIKAERQGAIEELTLWTLKRAVSDQLTLLDHGIDMRTFVNLSGHLISDSEFTLQAIEIIKAAQGRIGLEITETSVIRHAGNALANLELFSAAGAEIAIDDYGTGLSSLRYLKRIPAQELKIDREFIKDLTSSHRDPMIVRSTIDLAHALGLRVTAEGVDDPTKMALLKVMGCDQLQGFLIARPMPLTQLIEFMADKERQEFLINSKVSLLPGVASGEAK